VAKAERFVQLKVTLNDIRPPIWRRLVLPSATTLEDLHFIILAAMGWQGGHLHAFRAAEREYSDPSEVEDAADESRMSGAGASACNFARRIKRNLFHRTIRPIHNTRTSAQL
jgi:hypothetical protein